MIKERFAVPPPHTQITVQETTDRVIPILLRITIYKNANTEPRLKELLVARLVDSRQLPSGNDLFYFFTVSSAIGPDNGTT